MARDAQLAGDRVQTEYYLQFADHYFRVLGEARPRFDEQKRGRDDDQDDDGDDRLDWKWKRTATATMAIRTISRNGSRPAPPRGP